MTWEERCKMLRDSKPDCIVEMEVSERNLADSEQEALKAFADELVKRTTVPSNVVKAILTLLHEAGVPQ